jgi:hypothetical protein
MKKLYKYPYNIMLGPKTFEGEGITFLPDVQKNPNATASGRRRPQSTILQW